MVFNGKFLLHFICCNRTAGLHEFHGGFRWNILPYQNFSFTSKLTWLAKLYMFPFYMDSSPFLAFFLKWLFNFSGKEDLRDWLECNCEVRHVCLEIMNCILICWSTCFTYKDSRWKLWHPQGKTSRCWQKMVLKTFLP